ncbi:hypothetical protein WN944_015992 [Citrus x changshan-huyou]|uniref:PGG domain-containing protein n=1 Tax=Citrus x changshan-huyou TaxID=2935761 RepID=A0AAP0QK05_9ROSI
MEKAMGNTALHKALFMRGRVNVGRTSTADSFLSMARSYFSSNPTLAIDDTIKTNIIDSLVAIAHFLVSLDPKLSCCKNIKDKCPLALAIEIGNTDVLEYILRSLPSGLSWSSGKSPLQVVIKKINLDVLQLINQHKPELLLLEDRNGNILHHIFEKVLPDGSSLLHVAAKSGHGEITAKIAQYYPFLINKTNNQGDTPLHCAARAGKLNTATALVDFAKHIPSTSHAPVDLLRMENAMGNTALHEALFMLGRVNVGRTSTADSFLPTARSYFSSNPTLAIDDTIKTNIIDSLVAIAHFLVSLDPKLSCCKNIEDKSPLSLAIEMGNTDVLEYILRSLPSGINWSSDKSPLQVVIKKINLEDRNENILHHIFEKVLPDGSSLLHVAAKSGHGEITAKIAQYYPFFINKTNNQGNTHLHCAARAGMLNIATALVDFAKHIPSTSQALVDLLRMENAMGNTALHEALFMLGSVNVGKISTADSFLSMAHSYFSSNPTLAIDDTFKKNIINFLVAIAHFLISLDHKLSCCKNIEDKSPLSLAIEMGNTDVLEYILRRLPSGISWSSGQSSLQVVIKKRNLEDRTGNILHHIFEKVLPDGSSLLHVAAKSGHGEITAKIAQYYPFLINKTNNQGDTPLHCAARAGKLNTVTALVDFAKHIPSTSQAAVDLLRMENAMGNTALHEALFMLGRVNVGRTSTTDSFLSMACSYFSSNPTLAIDDTIKTNIIDSLVAIAHFLVSLDPKLSCCKNIEDKSPLSLAIEMGNTNVLEYISRSLPSGINWSSDKSPLQVVIKKINLGVCYLLEVNGYSALKKNKETLYPIHLACKNGHLNVIVELLKEWRCPSLFVTDNGCNILHFAAKNGHANMVKAIIKIPETNMTMDEVVNKMDEDGNTPLHLASLHGHSQVVYALLRYGRSNPDLKNKQSMTTYKMALREYYMQTSIAEKQEKSMKLQTTDEKSIGRAESLGASSRKSNENQDQLPIAYGESSGASAQRSHEFQDKLEKTLSIFLVTTRILKGESMPFLNPLLVGKLSEKEVQGFRKTLLVVAVLILGIAYSASEKMPSLDDADSSNSGGTFSIQKLKTMIKQFLVFDNVGMNSATIAVLILLWAQIVKHNSTFKMVLVASMLVCLSIFSMSITFYYSEAIHVKKDFTSSPAIKFLAPLFMPIQAVLLFLLSISAFKLNHVLGLGQLHWYYFSLWVVFEHKKLKTGRLKWWKNG